MFPYPGYSRLQSDKMEGASLAAVILGSISLVLLLICLALILLRRHLQGARCHSLVRLEDKVAVVTGANTGIGFETALDLSSRGAKVILLCRSLERGEAAATTIRAATGGEVEVEKLDLASLASVRECAAKLVLTLEKIHILENNAGVMACPLTRTEDGFEMQMGTNHLGPFLLTSLLLPLLHRAAPGSRIVTVSSLAHEQGTIQWDDIHWERVPYSATKAYCQSKLANVLFTKELGQRLEGSGVCAYSLHPGVVATDLARHVGATFGPLGSCAVAMIRPFIKTAKSGAQTSIYCAVDAAVKEDNGLYYSDCRQRETKAQVTKRHCRTCETCKTMLDNVRQCKTM